MQIEMSEFVKLENKNGVITADREGIEALVAALEKKDKELAGQISKLTEQRKVAAQQAKEYKAFLASSPPKRKRGRPRKTPNGAAKA